ncbi:MAG: ABC transporter substrate-binding protein [Deltaproteobacteria bacterium]|nr:ABC transporter substrate-binding protein [Deltaproteobacteria bacterium]
MKIFLRTFIVALLLFVLATGTGFAAPKEVKIGVIFPLSGGLATTGKLLRIGVELAAEIVNNKTENIDIPMAKWEGIPGLGGAKIKLIFMDHRSDPARGADLAKRLIKDEKVVGILGCYNSSVTKSVSTVCERYGVPMINSNSTSPPLTTRGYKWFWRTTPHNVTFSHDLYKFLIGLTKGKSKGVGKVPMKDLERIAIAGEETEFGATGIKVLEELAPKYGFKVVKAIKYRHQSPDLTSEVQAIRASNPGVVAFIPYVSDAILFMRTFKSMKFSPKIVWGQDAGTVQPGFAEGLKKDAVGVLTRTVFVPKIAEVKPVAKQVNSLFKKRSGEDFSGTSARAFTGLQTWAYVLNNAKSTDPKAIQKAANALYIPGKELIMPWKGIKFGGEQKGEMGQNILGSGMIAQWQVSPGDTVPHLEAVYPFEYATAKLIYPFPKWK